MSNKIETWIAIHEGIRMAKPIEKQVELLLLRELFYQIKELNENIKTFNHK